MPQRETFERAPAPKIPLAESIKEAMLPLYLIAGPALAVMTIGYLISNEHEAARNSAIALGTWLAAGSILMGLNK